MKQVVEERPIVRPSKHCLDLTRKGDRFVNGPLREQSRVDHQEGSLVMKEWLATKPGDQFIAVFRFQDVVNRVLVSYRGNAFCGSEQEEVMIAQHNTNCLAETSDESEEGKRIRATIDEIADQP